VFIPKCSRDCEIHFKTKWISARQKQLGKLARYRANSLVSAHLIAEMVEKSSLEIKEPGTVY